MLPTAKVMMMREVRKGGGVGGVKVRPDSGQRGGGETRGGHMARVEILKRKFGCPCGTASSTRTWRLYVYSTVFA